MALTATEEALLRNLLEKQAQLIALANNETTITAKLSSTKATIDDLTAATTVADADLMIVRQGGVDKKLPVSAIKSDLMPLASPALTGTPTAPTAAAGTSTTQIATTAFVQQAKPATATQAEMEAGTESSLRSMSPLGVAQAIAAKATSAYIGGRGQVFTSSGTFTVPTGVTSVKVRGCGGGAGIGYPLGASQPPAYYPGSTTSFGAYCSATGGGTTGPGIGSGGDINLAYTSYAGIYGYGSGGYEGGYFEKYITGLTPGQNITVTIGQGGAAGSGGYAGAPGICIVEW